ncbi:MAG: carboxypeptidase regulatory-like domain-containing protein [Taibaiella sp.]|nr:carboxypeptidase regulatory-like domain-containing protein [Taibaiella sp.]
MKHHHPIQISIPQPCSEDWNKMTPQEQGRFCDNCQKCVVDFTGFTDEQLYKYFREHKGENVCGRFQNWQLKRQVALPPEPRNRLYKWFISLGFVIFLAELLGTEAKAQGQSGKILGTILDMDGNYLPNVLVQISEGEFIRDSAYTNQDGAYMTKKLPPGKYAIFIQHPSFAKKVTTEVLVTPDRNTEVNTKLKPCVDLCSEIDTSIFIIPKTIIMGGVSTNHTLTGDEIERMPTRNIDNKKSNFFVRLWNKLF